MPVNVKEESDSPLSQRDVYDKSALTRFYWQLKDNVLIQMLPGNPEQIFDIGCGEGITLETFTRSFPSALVQGIDYLDENVNICKNYGLNCQQGDLYNLDIPSNSVDVIIFMEVIEHLENPEQALLELHRILRSGGIMIIGFPNDHFFLIARLLTFKFKEAKYDPGHVKQWTPKTMKQALQETGFTPVQTKLLPFGIWPFSLHGIIKAKKE